MFMASGLILMAVSGLVYGSPRIRKIESELPDMLPEAAPEQVAEQPGSQSAGHLSSQPAGLPPE
jgi:hypothetical protein